MSKFKIGDTVKCINDGGFALLEVGKIYEVLYADHDSIGVTAPEAEFFSERFVKAHVPRLHVPRLNGAEEYEEAMAAMELIEGSA